MKYCDIIANCSIRCKTSKSFFFFYHPYVGTYNPEHLLKFLLNKKKISSLHLPSHICTYIHLCFHKIFIFI